MATARPQPNTDHVRIAKLQGKMDHWSTSFLLETWSRLEEGKEKRGLSVDAWFQQRAIERILKLRRVHRHAASVTNMESSDLAVESGVA